MSVDTELGSYYFRHIAEDHKRVAQRDYPGRKVEVREVVHEHTQSRRPTFHVVLLAREESDNGNASAGR